MIVRLPQLRHRGFTLVELLVVIAILAVLAAFVILGTSNLLRKARAVDAVNRVRQCGAIIMGEAQGDGGKLSIFVRGSGTYDRAIRDILKDHGMGNESIDDIAYTPVFQKTKKSPISRWTAWGTNMDDHQEMGIDWEETKYVSNSGRNAYVQSLWLASCESPSTYPLMADSSDSAGVPRLRFSNSRANHRFAMRYRGKGPVLFLDGSAQMVGEDTMGDFGITTAYLFEGDPLESPTLVTAEDTFSK